MFFRLLFTTAFLKQFIYLTTIIGCCYLFIATNGFLSQANWFLLTALTFAWLPLANTPFSTIKIFLITGVILSFNIFMIGLLSDGIFSFVYLTLCISLTTWAVQKNNIFAFPSLLINSIMILAFSIPTNFILLKERTYFVLLAISLLLLLHIIFLPYFQKTQYKIAFKSLMLHLQNMSQDIFACLLQTDYPEHTYLYEKRLHDTKLLAKKSIKYLIQTPHYSNLSNFIQKIILIYQMLASCALIRTRVTDHSTFNLCQIELAALNRLLSKIFYQLTKFPVEDAKLIHQLNQAIANLDDTYHHVLQVAANDSIAFLIFIEQLKSLSAILQSIYLNKE